MDELEVEELKDKFYENLDDGILTFADSYDQDEDGRVCLDEVKKYFVNIGTKYPEKAAATFWANIKGSDTGYYVKTSEIKEFVRKGLKIRYDDDIEKMAKIAITSLVLKYDKDKNKSFGKSELIEMLSETGCETPDKESEYILKEFDTDKTGSVSIAQLEKYLIKKNSL